MLIFFILISSICFTYQCIFGSLQNPNFYKWKDHFIITFLKSICLTLIITISYFLIISLFFTWFADFDYQLIEEKDIIKINLEINNSTLTECYLWGSSDNQNNYYYFLLPDKNGLFENDYVTLNNIKINNDINYAKYYYYRPYYKNKYLRELFILFRSGYEEIEVAEKYIKIDLPLG